MAIATSVTLRAAAAVADRGDRRDPYPFPRYRGDEPFDVIIPSLPGFEFSTPLSGRQWMTAGIAGAGLELMTRPGYERFAVQGDDIGAAHRRSRGWP